MRLMQEQIDELKRLEERTRQPSRRAIMAAGVTIVGMVLVVFVVAFMAGS